MAEIDGLIVMTCAMIVMASGANNRFNQDWWYNDGRGAGFGTWGPENEGKDELLICYIVASLVFCYR